MKPSGKPLGFSRPALRPAELNFCAERRKPLSNLSARSPPCERGRVYAGHSWNVNVIQRRDRLDMMCLWQSVEKHEICQAKTFTES